MKEARRPGKVQIDRLESDSVANLLQRPLEAGISLVPAIDKMHSEMQFPQMG